MNIWQNITSIVNNNLEFTKVKYKKVTDDAKGYIYFDDGQGADCMVDMAIRYLFYLREPTEEYYTSYPLSSGQVVELDTPMRISTYTKLDAVNNYLFWADDPTYEEPPSDEDNVPTETTVIKITSTELRLREKEQVRPTDQTQEWTDTGNFRDDAEFDVRTDDCSCGILFRWVSVGEICDGVNVCEKLQFQRKSDCNSEWEVYQPEIYKVGEVIEYDSGICGTHEYKEDWLDDALCGSYINTEYDKDYDATTKYKIKVPFIKKKTDEEWTQLNCKTITDVEVIKTNSFECGWEGTRITYTYDNDLCGDVAMETYPELNGLTSTNKYDVTIKHYWHTEPYPTNTDEMTEDEWIWTETATTYSSTVSETKSCDCGYYYLQFDETDEYACGSTLGEGYTETTMYVKHIENKYCSGNLLEPTGVEKWVVYDTTSCECGYRETSSTTEYDYTYVCGDTLGDDYDDGYMYYKKIVKTYRQCVDGSNQELIDTQESYLKARHSTSSVTTCVLNQEYNAYINKLVTTYRTYYDENDNVYKMVECGGNNIVISEKLTVKSKDCGWNEEWTVSGSVCCGNLELEPAILTITETSGNWLRDNYTFTSNTISHTYSTKQVIKFTLSKDAKIDLNYDISSESGYDKFYYSAIDGTSATSGGISGIKTGTVTFNVTAGEHSIIIEYRKDNSSSVGRDNVIVTIGISNKQCTEYGKYNLEVYRYSTDSGQTWVTKVPEEYRYGAMIESNSEECGYIPRLEHWVLVCPDITYETAQEGDECTICSSYNGAPTMFAIEKKQYSIDGGKTWIDVTPLETRTERILKWKADKCGYTGDTFEYRWTDTYCNGTNLIGTRTTFVSSDNGKTWSEVEGTSIIAVKEENSSDCQDEGTE